MISLFSNICKVNVLELVDKSLLKLSIEELNILVEACDGTRKILDSQLRAKGISGLRTPL